MDGRKHATLTELGEKLAGLADDLAGVAADLQQLGAIGARDFERQARDELAELIALVEGPDEG
jgi:hypothetical protein